MSDSYFSPSWYRVAKLKPRLRSHTQIHRHEYRGRVWYILQDHAGGKSHRFTPAAWRFIGLMDGELTVQQLWDAVSTQAGDEAPTQDEVIRLLGQLHAADALICDVVPDSQELFRRFRKHQRMKLKQRIWTPLAVRFPLFDPEQFLERTYPHVSFLFNWFGVALWTIVVVCGAVLAAVHWDDLTKNIVDQALTPKNLVVLWFVYPVVKALHELGHGYAAKYAGGEVHEIGIMLLVLMPVPYVDVSSAWGFRDKRKRMLVGAAGIAVELFLGALAMFVWLNVESGSAHVIAYNVMLISGISTLLFNGNPLLRFDGYYVLADAIEIPNLGNRSNKYLGYLIQRYLFGSRDAESPADTRGERVWFVVYGIAAFIYRMFIMFAIILYIGGKFFVVGVALAIWATITQIVIPMGKSMKFLFSSPRLRRNRKRSLGTSVLILAVIIALLFVLPAPFWTRADGVTWPTEQSQVRAGADGFIVRLLAPAGSQVQAEQALIELRDPFLEARVAVLKARQKELKSQLLSAQATDRVQTAVIREELAATNADLERARERSDALTIRSQREGVFIIPQEQDLPNRFVRKGQLMAYIVEPSDLMTVRVVVPHDEVGLVHDHTRRVDVMPADWGAKPFQAEVLREVPGGTTMLPTAALGAAGGGRIAVDPRDPDGRTTLERVFEVEIGLPGSVETAFLGRRMYVRFDHGYKPVGLQLYRSLRQLFLRVFSV
jgi:putative peptide zinc metalloprotease protein